MTSSSVLGLRGISHRPRRLPGLDRVDFMVDRGEVRGLIGSNGAVQVDLLNVVVGRVEPDAGSIEFLGAEMRAVPAWRRFDWGSLSSSK